MLFYVSPCSLVPAYVLIYACLSLFNRSEDISFLLTEGDVCTEKISGRDFGSMSTDRACDVNKSVIIWPFLLTIKKLKATPKPWERSAYLNDVRQTIPHLSDMLFSLCRILQIAFLYVHDIASNV